MLKEFHLTISALPPYHDLSPPIQIGDSQNEKRYQDPGRPARFLPPQAMEPGPGCGKTDLQQKDEPSI